MVRALLATIITRKPWLIPILYTIHSLGGSLKITEIRETLGIRSAILKRGLWWLQKFGLIEKSDDKVVINSDCRIALDKLFFDICRTRNYFIIKHGSVYVVISVKKTRIAAYTMPVQIIEELNKLSRDVGAEFSAKDFSKALSIPPKLAYRAVKTRRLLLECYEKKK